MREIILGIAALSGLGTAGYMTGTFGSGEYYEIAPHEVSSTLADMRIPLEFSERSAGVQVHTVSSSAQKVHWEMVFDGSAVADVFANLSPSGSGTRVTIDFAMRESGTAKLDQQFPMGAEFFHDMAELAMTEQVDATLDGRPFDKDKFAGALVGYAAANTGKIVKFQQNMQDQALSNMKEFEAQSASASDSGFDETAEFASSSEPDSSGENSGDGWAE